MSESTSSRVPSSLLHQRILDWYAHEARDLPWRRPGTSPWGVMVSEVMLQQTPVVRVEPVWGQWISRWPSPAALAASAPGDAVHAWGRLGYPRRALRLHAAAVAMVERHDGDVPDTEEELLALPGVGPYTAAAVSAFAFGRRATVVDTNVRRVFARIVDGAALASPSLTRAEMDLATGLLPEGAGAARTWSAAVMEIGALVCSARSPRCPDCPVDDLCAWQRAGRPAYEGPPRRASAVARHGPASVGAPSLARVEGDAPRTRHCGRGGGASPGQRTTPSGAVVDSPDRGRTGGTTLSATDSGCRGVRTRRPQLRHS